MKKFTKALSVVLAVMMIMCTISALSFSASAAEANKVSLTSNVGRTVSYDYSADSTKVTVTYKLQSSMLIENIQAVVSYDSSVLSLASSNTKSTISPVFYGSNGGGFEANLGLKNTIKFNATNPDGYNFTKGAVVFTAVFDIIGQGSTAVDLDVYVLTGTENNKDVKMIYRDKVINNNFTLTASGSVETPVSDSATIYFAAPKGSTSTYNWSGVELYYGSTTNIDTAKRIALTKTDKVVDVTVPSSFVKSVSGAWDVYKVTLTKEQITAINAASTVGFVNSANKFIRTGPNANYAITKAPVTANGSYGAKTSITAFDGKTFIISGCYSTSAEVNTYTGYWSDDTGYAPVKTEATIRFAAPKGSTSTYNWSGVELYYGSTTDIDTAKRIALTKTDKVVDVTVPSSFVKSVSGEWEIYEAKLTKEQITAINAASTVGFVNSANKFIRTGPNANYAITKAPVTANGSYGANTSITAFDGKTFIISGCYSKSAEVNTYTGYWSDDTGYVPVVTEATIRFAAPKGSASKYNWSGVELYYGSTTDIDTAKRIALTKTDKVVDVTVPSSFVKSVSGEWEIYEVKLTKEQITAINAASTVGFVNSANKFIRTGPNANYAITKAPVTANGSYGANTSITAFDGKTFIISGCYSKSAEVNTYTGYWSDDTGYVPVVTEATIYFAAPKGSKSTYNWNGVELYYGSTTNIDTAERIALTKTDKTVNVTVPSSFVKSVSGEWDVYKVTLTAEQISAIDAASTVGFVNPANKFIRTGPNANYAITKAPVTAKGSYGAKTSIAAFDGKTFIINGCYSTSAEVNTYTGYWTTI